METISLEQIKQVWHCHLAMENGRDIEDLMIRFRDEQPALVAWHLAFFEKYPARTGRDLLLPMALVVWDAMTRAKGERLKAVTLDDLAKSAEAERKAWDELESLPEDQAKLRRRQLVEACNQRHLFEFCLTYLAVGSDDLGLLNLELYDAELAWIECVIDCLDEL
jgi:hypothetical protein